MANCSITAEGCSALFTALQSNPSQLRELNLNSNKPGDSVKELSDLLKKENCTLEKLQLALCHIGDEGCADLSTALRLNPSSHLRELNLDGNDPGASGLMALSNLLQDPNCKLEKL
ncbi:hypothetical protein NFI96_031519 [Prochilodus magdalenae]|nr:hypothetical protein NFI96_031519 [Prochilodus magdalenae]